VNTRYRSTVRRISTQEVAERAGVDLDYLSRLVDLGLVVPDADGTFSEGDARRARLYRGLERAGLPTEPMIEAVERGALSFAFLDLPVYTIASPVSAARRSGRSPPGKVSRQSVSKTCPRAVLENPVPVLAADPGDTETHFYQRVRECRRGDLNPHPL
jgi:hypothetical protein